MISLHQTNLAKAIDEAINAVSALRQTGNNAIPRIYILTDGELSDPDECRLRASALEELKAEVNSYGFGKDFSFQTMKSIIGNCRGGMIKAITNHQDIVATFHHLVNVSSNLIASDAKLNISFSPQLIPGDFFSHRPIQKCWQSAEFTSNKTPSFEIGNIEAQRSYIWAIEGRLPSGVEPGYKFADICISYRRLGREEKITWPLTVPISVGDQNGAANPEVTRILTSLCDLRDSNVNTQIAAYKARIEIAKLEKRDQAYIRSLEEVLNALESGQTKGSIGEDVLRLADSSPITMISLTSRFDE